jgi:hypothetical protein
LNEGGTEADFTPNKLVFRTEEQNRELGEEIACETAHADYARRQFIPEAGIAWYEKAMLIGGGETFPMGES